MLLGVKGYNSNSRMLYALLVRRHRNGCVARPVSNQVFSSSRVLRRLGYEYDGQRPNKTSGGSRIPCEMRVATYSWQIKWSILSM